MSYKKNTDDELSSDMVNGFQSMDTMSEEEREDYFNERRYIDRLQRQVDNKRKDYKLS
jgi:hypothetical protein